jgi:hypothetical protein
VVVNEAFHKLVPVLGMGCFMYPGYERAIVINSNYWDFGKQQTKVSYNVVLFVKEELSGELHAVTTCGVHVLGWMVMGSVDDFANKFHLPCSNHVPCPWYIVKHASDVFVLYPLLLDPRY